MGCECRHENIQTTSLRGLALPFWSAMEESAEHQTLLSIAL